MFHWCYNCEFGIKSQLSTGVTEDGFWFEGSILYNFFLLEGITSFMLLSEVYNQPFEQKEKLILNNMLVKAYMYSFDNDILPNPNDGWPNLNLKTFSNVYHMASRVFGEDSKIGNITKLIENEKNIRTTLPLSQSIYSKDGIALERLLFNTDFDYSKTTKIQRKNYNYQQSNFAMLRNNKLNLFIKYGLNGASHAHPDILNLEVVYKNTLISRDISNAGYKSTLCNKWHRQTICHNTVICGGENITSRSPGIATLLTNKIIASHQDVYENIDYKRECIILEDGFEDVFSVKSQNNKPKDFIFHVESKFKIEGKTNQTKYVKTLGYEDNGYQYLEDICELDASEIKLTDENLKLYLSFIIPPNSKLYMMKTLDNPVTKKRTSFLIRSNEKSPTFKMKLKCKEL